MCHWLRINLCNLLYSWVLHVCSVQFIIIVIRLYRVVNTSVPGCTGRFVQNNFAAIFKVSMLFGCWLQTFRLKMTSLKKISSTRTECTVHGLAMT